MRYALIWIFIFFFNISNSQIEDYIIQLDSFQINGFHGLQSFAFGQSSGKVILIGGRLDGLHQRQPFASFDLSGHNRNIILLDLQKKKMWQRSIGELNQSLREQLSSTNHNFYQEDSYLYLFGGYGYSDFKGDHTTFEQVIAIDLPGLIDALLSDHPISPYFRQVNNPLFSVTGGQLEKIYDHYYLVGGQKFEGRYNPMGMPSFTQTYTDEIRIFSIDDNGRQLIIKNLGNWHDKKNLHRRDYNVVAQIMLDGTEGLTAFSGVFQEEIDLPFLHPVHIETSGFYPVTGFRQLFNHYHCANIPLYDTVTKDMHTLFFGGMAQFYMEDSILVQDNEVPFVKSISRVTRDSTGKMTEQLYTLTMPALLGGSAEFIVNPNLLLYKNGVIKFREINSDRVFLGYIIGGIESSRKNIFWINDGSQSRTNNQILEVYLNKINPESPEIIVPGNHDQIPMIIYPNPIDGDIIIQLELKEKRTVFVQIYDSSNELMYQKNYPVQKLGTNYLRTTLEGLEKHPYIFVKISDEDSTTLQKVIIN